MRPDSSSRTCHHQHNHVSSKTDATGLWASIVMLIVYVDCAFGLTRKASCWLCVWVDVLIVRLSGLAMCALELPGHAQQTNLTMHRWQSTTCWPRSITRMSRPCPWTRSIQWSRAL